MLTWDDATERERWAWAAGVLDSEGCFDRACGSPTGGGYPRIQVGMNDLDTIERLSDVLGFDRESIAQMETKKGSKHYKISLFGDDAIRVMRTVLPLMSARRAAKIHDVLENN